MRIGMNMRNHSNSGQILLIVVLSMVVALTVGLSIASRTISNLKISKQNEESQRAFQAAEAGVERAIDKILQGCMEDSTCNNIQSINLGNQAMISNVEVKQAESNLVHLNGRERVEQAVGIDVWLSKHPNFAPPYYTGDLTIYWGEGQSCTSAGNKLTAALEVLIIHGSPDDPQLTRYVYDPCTGNNRLSPSSAPIVEGEYEKDSIKYNYTSTIRNITNGLLMKVIPSYNSTRIAIEADDGKILPSQGSTIESVGKSGDTVRKIQYFQSYPQIPNELFPYAIISQ